MTSEQEAFVCKKDDGERRKLHWVNGKAAASLKVAQESEVDETLDRFRVFSAKRVRAQTWDVFELPGWLANQNHATTPGHNVCPDCTINVDIPTKQRQTVTHWQVSSKGQTSFMLKAYCMCSFPWTV